MTTSLRLLIPVVLVSGGLLTAQNTALTFRPVDAEYSNALDRIILVSASPNQIHIYNPVSRTDTALNLAAAPNAVSVSPDGRYAAVGHNNLISYVDLTNATVQKTLTVALNVTELVLAADYVYILPTMSVRISDGLITNALPSYQVPIKGLLSDGAIYSQDYSSLTRRPVTGATIGTATTNYTYSSCYYSNPLPDPVVYPGGNGIFDGCGRAWLGTAELPYSSSLPGPSPESGIGRVVALATNALRGMAAVPVSGVTYAPLTIYSADNEIYFYASAHPPVLQGKFVIPDFAVNSASYQAHARWLFFDSAGARLYAIHQADSSSGLLNDFAVFTLNFPPAACNTSLPSNTATAPGAGGLLSVQVTTAANCAYQASTNDSWIQLPLPYGGGPTTLSYQVRPNRTGTSRTGTITIGSQTLTVTQPAAPAAALAFQLLSFKVRQAEFSKSRGRLLLTSAYPNELHIIDPATQEDVIVSLPFVPTAMSLSPNGDSVGVGGDGAAVFVNVSTGALVTPALLRTSGDVLSMVLSNDGYAYSFTGKGVLSIQNLNTGSGKTLPSTGGTVARLQQPGNRYIYAYNSYSFNKWDLTTAATPVLLGNPGGSSGSYYCAQFWLSEDGTRLFSQCGSVYRTSEVLAADLSSNGTFSGLTNGANWIANSLAAKTTAVIPQNYYYSTAPPNDTEIHLYGDEFLSYLGKTTLPTFDVSGATYPGRGRFAFWNAAADRIYVVMQADSTASLTADYAIYTYAAANNCAVLNNGTQAAFAMDAATGQIAVTASCAWKATSSAPWLTITSGGFGVGSATLNYSISKNDTGSTRSATISFGTQTYTITQSSGSITLNPTASSFGAIGGSATVGVTTSPASVAWTAASSVSWIRITSGGSGTGTGTVGYSVSPNAATTSRTGNITIGGVTFSVTQAGSTGTVQINQTYFYLDGAGASGSTPVTATGTWLAVANDSWIVITTPANGIGNGNGTLAFTVDRNPNPAARQGTITVNGQTIQVNQYEPPATLTFSPASLNLAAAGGTGTVNVTSSSPNYYWYTYSNASWLTTGTSRAGSGPFTYTASANTSSAARSATITVGTFTFNVTQAGLAPPPAPLTAGLHFVPVTPCRIADTRENLGAFGKPALASGAERSFVIAQAPCNIPSNAKAYSMNVTVVPKGPLGYITIWPTGKTMPFVSTLNSIDGRVKANAAIVPAGTNGAVSVVATDATEFIMDINGYFIEPNLNPSALAFYPIRPCRIADTREPNAALGGPRIEAGGTRSFPVLSANCGIPSTARAYSMNATVVPGGPLGYISMWPTGQAQPFVSTLNAPTGAIVANAALVPAGTGGEVSVFAQGQTHIILDVNGYFAPAGSVDAQKFYAITPCRLVDTREPTGSLGGPVMALSDVRSYPLAAANCGLPSSARAYSLNATVVPTTILGYMTLWPTGQSQPFVSTLNVTDDKIVANAAIVPVGTNGAVSSYVTNQTHLILDTNGYFAQ